MSLNLEQALITASSAVIASKVMADLAAEVEDGWPGAAAFGTKAGKAVASLIDGAAAEAAAELEGKDEEAKGALFMESMMQSMMASAPGEDGAEPSAEQVEAISEKTLRFLGIGAAFKPELKTVMMLMGGMPIYAMAIVQAKEGGTTDRDGLAAAAREAFEAYAAEAGEVPEGMEELKGAMAEGMVDLVDQVLAGGQE